jgi:hypothetical protein
MMADPANTGEADERFRAQRRALIAQSPTVYGIDWVELAGRHRDRIAVDIHFIRADDRRVTAIPGGLREAQITLSAADEPERANTATRIRRHVDRWWVLTVDFAPLGRLGGEPHPTEGIVRLDHPAVDPFFSDRLFELRQPGPLSRDPGAPEPADAPPGAVDVDYLSRDFDGYRGAMLDHMAALQPLWREQHAADMGVAVVEVLAYAADQLSYYQDAVATEAYLSTARRRVSLKRHARLLDYAIHQGCAARAWVQIAVDGEGGRLAKGLPLTCRNPDLRDDALRVSTLRGAPPKGAVVFQTMVDAYLYPEHTTMSIYAWGVSDFRLPPGAVATALAGHFPHLKSGDVIIFAQVLDPITGDRIPGPPPLAQPVRLTGQPALEVDPLTGKPITRVSWSREDAPPFEMPITRSAGGAAVDGIFVALGNIVPAECGFTFNETIGPTGTGSDLRVVLSRDDLLYVSPFDPVRALDTPAAALVDTDPQSAMPDISIQEIPPWQRPKSMPIQSVKPTLRDRRWRPVRDLLASDRFARDFVVDVEDDGAASLRFGDDRNGAAAAADSLYAASYRIGAPDSNVGAWAIVGWAPRPQMRDDFVIGVINPLPAAGGVQPQGADQIRVHAPNAFRTQQRCVVAQDYVDAVKADPRVADAVAIEQWSGCWNMTVVHVQPAAGAPPTDDLFDSLAHMLLPRRIIGADFRLRSPVYVPVRISLVVGVIPTFRPVSVEQGVAAAIRSLHRFADAAFGQAIYVSPIIGAVMSVPGVSDVRVATLRRLDRPSAGEVRQGGMTFGQVEIPVLDDCPIPRVHGEILVRAVRGGEP